MLVLSIEDTVEKNSTVSFSTVLFGGIFLYKEKVRQKPRALIFQ
jgi:hypothetical protein